MPDIKVGGKTYTSIQSVKLNTADGGTHTFPAYTYVIGYPVDYTLSAASWDGHTYYIYLTGYIIDAYGVQLGLPIGGSTTNAMTVIESALTIANSSSGTNTNTGEGYVHIYISAVDVPTEDVTISLYGLAEAPATVAEETSE